MSTIVRDGNPSSASSSSFGFGLSTAFSNYSRATVKREQISPVSRVFERSVLKALKPRLRVLEDEPLNAEAFPELLDDLVTPISSFFVRNTGRLPNIADYIHRWTLTVNGEVERPATFSLADLKNRFQSATITAVLECAGNGRSGFSAPTGGLRWRHGAVGCARWTGIRLADVLRDVGLKTSAVYTAHYSPDVQIDGSGNPALSRGLPIAKALAPETLLVFGMNDEPLPLLHGGPLRIAAPGFPGSAWQKWLTRIWVRDREHDGEKMTGTHYRLPSVPIAPGEAIDPANFSVIVAMPVRSLVTWPQEGFVVRTPAVEVRGYAWSGHTRVASVAVSADGGRTWQAGVLSGTRERFAWRRFTAVLNPSQPGAMVLMARATDEAGRSQPLDGAPWNPRGYCNNSVHRVRGFFQGE